MMNMKPPSGERQGVSPPCTTSLQHQRPFSKHAFTPCRIAVRAEIKKSMDSTKNRTRIFVRSAHHVRRIDQRRNSIRVALPMSLRFTDDCQLKTDDLAATLRLAFPIWHEAAATQTGFLNKCLELRLGGLSSPQPHSAQPRSSLTALVRTREVKALCVPPNPFFRRMTTKHLSGQALIALFASG
jgi:hypothetical protein